MVFLLNTLWASLNSTCLLQLCVIGLWIALMTARVFTLLKKTSLPCKRALLQGPPPFRGRSRRWPRVSNAMIADQLSTLVAQIQVLNQRQDRLERSKGFSATDVCFAGSRSKLPAACCFSWYPETRRFASESAYQSIALTGPPPKVRAPLPCRCGAKGALRCCRWACRDSGSPDTTEHGHKGGFSY